VRLQSLKIVAVAIAFSVAFFFPSLDSGSRNAGYLYTGDNAGFYVPTLFKIHDLLRSLNFAAIDYSLYNGSSDFFLSPNYYTFHPFILIYSFLYPVSHDNVLTLGQLTVLMMFVHVIAGMYFSTKLFHYLLQGQNHWISVLGGAVFTFGINNIFYSLGEPEFLFTVTPLPWAIYASIGCSQSPSRRRIILASVPIVLILVGGYIPVGGATLALGTVLTAAFILIDSERDDRRVMRLMSGLLPFAVGTAASFAYIIALFLYSKETPGHAATSLYYAAQQYSEAPTNILNVVSPSIFLGQVHEFTVVFGVLPLIIFVLFVFTKAPRGVGSPALTKMKLMLALYGMTVLAIYGSYSAVSNLVYYFLPLVGRMHIYQRFLLPDQLLLAGTIVIAASAIERERPLLAVRLALAVVLGALFILAIAFTAAPSAMSAAGIDQMIIVELIGAAFFLIALLLPGSQFVWFVGALLVTLPALQRVYQYSDGANTLSQRASAIPVYLNRAETDAVVKFFKEHAPASKSYVKYADLTPMWGKAPGDGELFPKQFPYLALKQIHLSSFGGFTFYLSGRADFLKVMPIEGDVRLAPNWDVLRDSGVDFLVVMKDATSSGILKEIAAEVPASDIMTLPRGVELIALRTLKDWAAPGTIFDDGMFRLQDENAARDIALGAPATESDSITPASLATDGNTDGDFSHGSVAHTGQSPFAWWQVDLGREQSLGRAVVWNRTDCCSNRLAHFWIFVSNAPFGENDRPSDLAKRPGTFSKEVYSGERSTVVDLAGVSGRYFRVQLAGSSDPVDAYLQLAEVQIFGPEPKRSDTSVVRSVSVDSNFANHASLDVDLAVPAKLTYLFWPNPRLSVLVNGRQIALPRHPDGYLTVSLPTGQNNVEIRYSNVAVIATWLSYAIYWLIVVVAWVWPAAKIMNRKRRLRWQRQPT
jgi:hypothetical protein